MRKLFVPTRIGIRNGLNSNSTELDQVVHTRRTTCNYRSVWPRGFGELNPSPHSWIFTSVSVGSSPLPYLPLRLDYLVTLHQSVAQNWSDMWLSTDVRDRRGAASLRYRNHAQITAVMCEGKPYPVWFSCRRKSYPLLCKHGLKYY